MVAFMGSELSVLLLPREEWGFGAVKLEIYQFHSVSQNVIAL